jgi:hypothetical protein
MKTTTKWILGIIIGLVVVTAVSALAIFAMAQWGSLGWMANERSFMPRTFERSMPMHPYADGSWLFMSRFNPLWIIGRTVLWIGVLALIVLGITALVRMLNKTDQAAAIVGASTAPLPERAAPVQAVQNCPACSRLVQQEWSHCPYCGDSLAESA